MFLRVYPGYTLKQVLTELTADQFYVLLQQGAAAVALDKIEYKLLKPLKDEDHAELLGAMRETKEMLEFVDSKYVRVDESDVKQKDDVLLKDIFSFFGIQANA